MKKLYLFLILTITSSNKSNEKNLPEPYSIIKAYHGNGRDLALHAFQLTKTHVEIYNTTGEQFCEEDQKGDKEWLIYFYIRLLQDAQCYGNKQEVIKQATCWIRSLESFTENFFSLDEIIEQEITDKVLKRVQKNTAHNLIGSPEWIQILIAPNAILDRKTKIDEVRKNFLKEFKKEQLSYVTDQTVS